jgi:hypothetical protein
MKRQIELAKKYGIYGFCFYYYWFSGDKLMEKPLQKFLDDKSLDMPFFLFWANEDWSMLWDNGNYKEVLHKQELHEDDAEKFMNDILPYMKDDRYIKIDNKPLLIIYQLQIFPFDKYISFVNKIRQMAIENGFDGLYLISTIKEEFDLEKLKDIIDKYKIDSLVEFYPQGLLHVIKVNNPEFANPDFHGYVHDVEEFVKSKRYLYETKANIFKGIFPNWDNTSRRCFQGPNILQQSPSLYEKWLKDIINWTLKNKSNKERFVFVNAWNEWAEGAHLEPDQKYGYAYLQATKDALADKNV